MSKTPEEIQRLKRIVADLSEVRELSDILKLQQKVKELSKEVNLLKTQVVCMKHKQDMYEQWQKERYERLRKYLKISDQELRRVT